MVLRSPPLLRLRGLCPRNGKSLRKGLRLAGLLLLLLLDLLLALQFLQKLFRSLDGGLTIGLIRLRFIRLVRLISLVIRVGCLFGGILALHLFWYLRSLLQNSLPWRISCLFGGVGTINRCTPGFRCENDSLHLGRVRHRPQQHVVEVRPI